jgi:predicted  nucleic acid-binding Zn-ribbon protein
MDPTDVTVAILREIRDEIRETNERLDRTRNELGARIDQTNERLDQNNQRITESEMRTATAIAGLAGTLGDVKELLSSRLELKDRVERCELEIAEIKQRLGGT